MEEIKLKVSTKEKLTRKVRTSREQLNVLIFRRDGGKEIQDLTQQEVNSMDRILKLLLMTGEMSVEDLECTRVRLIGRPSENLNEQPKTEASFFPQIVIPWILFLFQHSHYPKLLL